MPLSIISNAYIYLPYNYIKIFNIYTLIILYFIAELYYQNCSKTIILSKNIALVIKNLAIINKIYINDLIYNKVIKVKKLIIPFISLLLK